MSCGTTDESYREDQSGLERMLGQSLSLGAIETTVDEAALDVQAYYEQPLEPCEVLEAGTILVAQADGKVVPMLPLSVRPSLQGGGKEAVVSAVYTIAPYARTPEAVVAVLLKQRPRPSNKQVRSSLEGKPAALSGLAERAAQRDGEHLEHRVALTDGAEALQVKMREQLPQ